MTISPTATDQYPTRTAEGAALLERVDPVADPAATLRGAGPLAAEQVHSFDRDGFLLLARSPSRSRRADGSWPSCTVSRPTLISTARARGHRA